jgi:hypothetical protein
MKRCIFLLWAVGLLVIVAATASACGSSGPSTTVPTSVTTPAPSSTTPSSAAAATTEDYKTKLTAWVNGPLQKLDTSVFNIADPANATADQIQAVKNFITQAQAALAELRNIQPSAEAAVPHAQFVKAYTDLLAGTEKLVMAMESKDATQIPAVQKSMEAAGLEIKKAQTTLTDLLGLTPSTT